MGRGGSLPRPFPTREAANSAGGCRRQARPAADNCRGTDPCGHAAHSAPTTAAAGLLFGHGDPPRRSGRRDGAHSFVPESAVRAQPNEAKGPLNAGLPNERIQLQKPLYLRDNLRGGGRYRAPLLSIGNGWIDWGTKFHKLQVVPP